jgi:hypothetical protein
MIMRHGLPASAAITLAIGIAAPALAEVIPHRDDFVMNSIGGGDYRDYVLTYLDADDGLYVPMRTLGTLHNTMHQMMTELAIYARDDRDDEHVPDIGDRISGGDWTDYRKALEEAGEEGAWMDFVHVVEVMHDRVHHPMYKSVVYDFATMAREADLMDYVREPTRRGRGRADPGPRPAQRRLDRPRGVSRAGLGRRARGAELAPGDAERGGVRPSDRPAHRTVDGLCSRPPRRRLRPPARRPGDGRGLGCLRGSRS